MEFNKLQINALWAKIKSKVAEETSNPTYKSSSVEDIKSMINEGTLVPGTVYSYEIGTDDNKVTIYQEALTTNTLSNNGVMSSDNNEYDGKVVTFDINNVDNDSLFFLVIIDDGDVILIYENNELKSAACFTGVVANGNTFYRNIPVLNGIPETLTSGNYLVRVYNAPEDEVHAHYGGLCHISIDGNNATINVLRKDEDSGAWTVIDNKIVTSPADFDETVAFIDDVLHQLFGNDFNIETTTSVVSLSDIGDINPFIIDPES